MRIEQNTISWDWTVVHRGRRFLVNFTESDGQTLVLCNRENWRICEETEDGIEELNACVPRGSGSEEQKRAEESARMMEELMAFCVRHWDDGFMQGLTRRLKQEQGNSRE